MVSIQFREYAGISVGITYVCTHWESRMSTQLRPLGRQIDLDADPYVPEGWTVESHRRCGSMVWNPAKTLRFYLSRSQVRPIKGSELKGELDPMPVVNATLLDYLLDRQLVNPHFIPPEWKYDELGRTRYIFFWGTIYRFEGDLCVRYLRWNALRWEWSHGWIDSQWNSQYFALLMNPPSPARDTIFTA
jgi:hypothetical protein